MVDKLEAKIRGEEPVDESTFVADDQSEAPASSYTAKARGTKPADKKPKEAPKA